MPTPIGNPLFVTKLEASRRLRERGVQFPSRKAIDTAIARGELPALHVTRHVWLIAAGDLDAYVERRLEAQRADRSSAMAGTGS